MQQFDTIKISIPPDAVKNVNPDMWIHTQKMDGETGLTDNYKQAKNRSLPVGVSQLVSKENGDYQVTFSAKVLGDDYLTGITQNNWSRGLEILKPIIDINPNEVYDNSQVYRCDTTNNIEIEQIGYTPKIIYSGLMASKTNHNFREHRYNSRTKQGIIFSGVQQEKNRMIAYSKSLDLMKSDNKEFIKSLQHPVRMIEQATKQIRFEVNHTSFKSIRDRLQIETNSLHHVLTSSASVNSNFLKKICKVGTQQTHLFDDYQKFNGSGVDYIYYKGIQYIIQQLEYSDVAVRDFMQLLLGDNFKYHYYKKEYSVKKILQDMQHQRYGVSGEVSSVICTKLIDALHYSVAV